MGWGTSVLLLRMVLIYRGCLIHPLSSVSPDPVREGSRGVSFGASSRWVAGLPVVPMKIGAVRRRPRILPVSCLWLGPVAQLVRAHA